MDTLDRTTFENGMRQLMQSNVECSWSFIER